MPLATRRKLIVTAGAIALRGGWKAARADEAVGSAAKITDEFGENGGTEFPMEYPKSIGVRSSNLINALVLNGID